MALYRCLWPGDSTGDSSHSPPLHTLLARLRIDSRRLSNRQALHLHNLQSIGRRTWSRSQLVIKHHAPVMYLFAEMIIANTGYGIGQGDEFQVMSRNDANAMPVCESMDVGTAANEALPIIGAAKNFVDQEAQRYRLLSL